MGDAVTLPLSRMELAVAEPGELVARGESPEHLASLPCDTRRIMDEESTTPDLWNVDGPEAQDCRSRRRLYM